MKKMLPSNICTMSSVALPNHSTNSNKPTNTVNPTNTVKLSIMVTAIGLTTTQAQKDKYPLSDCFARIVPIPLYSKINM